LYGSPGSYGWNGGLGTAWFNDPAGDPTLILLTQRAMTSPEPPPVFRDFWASAYAALDE
jgi:CubicO group peptidase (beta-lactamase class C family)